MSGCSVSGVAGVRLVISFISVPFACLLRLCTPVVRGVVWGSVFVTVSAINPYVEIPGGKPVDCL
ncbi:hypothetical protein GCM10010961_01600 [Pseudodonghicola xiamenensis]|uniref:Uncharacterized protein n=1 Tax=Pseudodonghicola xiamenensis TaxID=337702 RepID=A0A8J3H2T7_9RHOB|nr:hypothetical protein GCM10010961_01600 [Pseudodonghicola xiamenensis]